MEANVILAKCSIHNQFFGVRIEKQKNDWVRTWAYKIDEAKAKREGFDSTPITGSLVAIEGFPGCPYCTGIGFVICFCGKMSCLMPETLSSYCYWCNNKMENLIESESFNLQVGGV